ncbi:MAG: FxsA family protein [Geodermatophilaceae bacterium]|nr:FxsA family protein [Geodermatophilaceae bacterium]
MPLLLLVVLFAAAEIFVLITVGSAIGAGWTILALLATSALGLWLLRREGSRALHAMREASATGRPPHKEIADGILIFFGGLLMILPGFLTDLLGLLCLFPPTRALIRRTLFALLLRRIPTAMFSPRWSRGGSVIEGEVDTGRTP